jgi:hypothetical protein
VHDGRPRLHEPDNLADRDAVANFVTGGPVGAMGFEFCSVVWRVMCSIQMGTAVTWRAGLCE